MLRRSLGSRDTGRHRGSNNNEDHVQNQGFHTIHALPTTLSATATPVNPDRPGLGSQHPHRPPGAARGDDPGARREVVIQWPPAGPETPPGRAVHDQVDQTQIEIPNCPQDCAIPMRLSRVIPGAAEDVASRIFVCDRCRTDPFKSCAQAPSRVLLPELAMADGLRRFPPPWRADKRPGGDVIHW